MSSPFVIRATSPGESATGLVKPDEVRAAAAVLADPAHGIQVQALPLAGWRTCRGDDPEEVVKAALELAPGSRGIYFTLNPCPRDMGQPMRSSSAVSRRWLLVDLDAKRPKDTNSTDAEHEAARAVAYQIQHDLSEEGWPTPVIIDSGNGWHLLYRVDLPNDDDSRVMLRKCLHTLAERHDNEAVEVDRKTHDARRISKLPGTLVRKGPADPMRPYRWAQIVLCPEEIEVVTVGQLRTLGGTEAPEAPAAAPPSVFQKRAGVDRKRAYAQRALQCEVANVVLAPARGGNDALNKAAFAVGQLVGAGALLRQEAEFTLSHAAMLGGRRGEEETRATIKSGMDAGQSKPRDLAFLDPPAATNGVHHPPATPRVVPAPEIYTLDRLMATEFPPPRWAIHGLLSEGLSILAGKPKMGKSFLALNLAITVAAGGRALGDIETVAGDVLYLALEDRLRRVQHRARKILAGLALEASSRLHIAVSWPRQEQGGLAHLDRWLDAADNPRLVIIDVVAKFRTASTGRRNVYDEDYEVLSQIKEMLDRRTCSGLGLMHLKKGKAEDPLEDISGSMGNSGAADGVLMLVRTRGEYEAVLGVTGRDVDEKKISIKFDPHNCCWSSLGDSELLTTSRVRQKIMAAFRAQPGGKWQPKGMADLINENPSTVRAELWRMLNEGQLRKIGMAYQWPVDEMADEGGGPLQERF